MRLAALAHVSPSPPWKRSLKEASGNNITYLDHVWSLIIAEATRKTPDYRTITNQIKDETYRAQTYKIFQEAQRKLATYADLCLDPNKKHNFKKQYQEIISHRATPKNRLFKEPYTNDEPPETTDEYEQNSPIRYKPTNSPPPLERPYIDPVKQQIRQEMEDKIPDLEVYFNALKYRNENQNIINIYRENLEVLDKSSRDTQLEEDLIAERQVDIAATSAKLKDYYSKMTNEQLELLQELHITYFEGTEPDSVMYNDAQVPIELIHEIRARQAMQNKEIQIANSYQTDQSKIKPRQI